MPTDLRFGIDRLVVSGTRVFGWGWIADRERSIRDVHLSFKAAVGASASPRSSAWLVKTWWMRFRGISPRASQDSS
jgi:hypothetical protein